MTRFDQRGQKVKNQNIISGNQYNAGGNITQVGGDMVYGDKVSGDKIVGDKVLGDKNVSTTIVLELEALLKQVQEGVRSGDLDADIAADAEYPIKKAAIEAAKPEPDKSKMLEYLDTAKTTLEKVVGLSKSAAALATALGTAYAKVKGWL
jgi:hypothetical protein